MLKTSVLTKAHIVQAITEHNGYIHKKSAETVDLILEIIKRSLEKGEDVLISRFRKFCLKQKAERRGRKPSTGKDMILAPKAVVFRAAKMMPVEGLC